MFQQDIWLPYFVVLSFIGLSVWAGHKAPRGAPAAQAEDKSGAQAKSEDSNERKKSTFRVSAVRYQIKDVDRAVAFYTQHLGFKLEQQQGPAFARISNGNLTLWLSGPQSSGSRAMPDGRRQEPGGWNRIVLAVDDLPSLVETMKKAGFRFRNQVETGPGGKQIQLEDPDGNPIELFEPAS
jgi:glyoxylase I family protein